MKKTIVFNLILIICATNIYAQNSNSDNWSDLRKFADESTFCYKINFDKAIINAQDADDFIKSEPNWDDGFKTMENRFSKAFNQEAYKGTFPHRVIKKEATYTINVNVQQVSTTLFSKRKTTLSAIISITDAEGHILFSRYIEERTGLFGTNMNLIGDVMGAVGITLGQEFFRNATR